MDDDGRPVAGFFGKLPSTGDFVSRGLPDAFRRNWDVWVTRHVAPLARDGTGLPDGGLRFRLASGGRSAAGVIIPSEDSAGRVFPLSLIVTADSLPLPAALDQWCDAALTAQRLGPDVLWEALEAILPPEPVFVATDVPALLLWRTGHPPLASTFDDPGSVLSALVAPQEGSVPSKDPTDSG